MVISKLLQQTQQEEIEFSETDFQDSAMEDWKRDIDNLKIEFVKIIGSLTFKIQSQGSFEIYQLIENIGLIKILILNLLNKRNEDLREQTEETLKIISKKNLIIEKKILYTLFNFYFLKENKKSTKESIDLIYSIFQENNKLNEEEFCGFFTNAQVNYLLHQIHRSESKGDDTHGKEMIVKLLNKLLSSKWVRLNEDFQFNLEEINEKEEMKTIHLIKLFKNILIKLMEELATAQIELHAKEQEINGKSENLEHEIEISTNINQSIEKMSEKIDMLLGENVKYLFRLLKSRANENYLDSIFEVFLIFSNFEIHSNFIFSIICEELLQFHENNEGNSLPEKDPIFYKNLILLSEKMIENSKIIEKELTNNENVIQFIEILLFKHLFVSEDAVENQCINVRQILQNLLRNAHKNYQNLILNYFINHFVPEQRNSEEKALTQPEVVKFIEFFNLFLGEETILFFQNQIISFLPLYILILERILESLLIPSPDPHYFKLNYFPFTSQYIIFEKLISKLFYLILSYFEINKHKVFEEIREDVSKFTDLVDSNLFTWLQFHSEHDFSLFLHPFQRYQGNFVIRSVDFILNSIRDEYNYFQFSYEFKKLFCKFLFFIKTQKNQIESDPSSFSSLFAQLPEEFVEFTTSLPLPPAQPSRFFPSDSDGVSEPENIQSTLSSLALLVSDTSSNYILPKELIENTFSQSFRHILDNVDNLLIKSLFIDLNDFLYNLLSEFSLKNQSNEELIQFIEFISFSLHNSPQNEVIQMNIQLNPNVNQQQYSLAFFLSFTCDNLTIIEKNILILYNLIYSSFSNETHLYMKPLVELFDEIIIFYTTAEFKLNLENLLHLILNEFNIPYLIDNDDFTHFYLYIHLFYGDLLKLFKSSPLFISEFINGIGIINLLNFMSKEQSEGEGSENGKYTSGLQKVLLRPSMQHIEKKLFSELITQLLFIALNFKYSPNLIIHKKIIHPTFGAQPYLVILQESTKNFLENDRLHYSRIIVILLSLSRIQFNQENYQHFFKSSFFTAINNILYLPSMSENDSNFDTNSLYSLTFNCLYNFIAYKPDFIFQYDHPFNFDQVISSILFSLFPIG